MANAVVMNAKRNLNLTNEEIEVMQEQGFDMTEVILEKEKTLNGGKNVFGEFANMFGVTD